LLLPARHRVWLISIVFSCLVVTGFAMPPGPKHPIASLFTSPLLIEFLYGCWIATLVIGGRLVGPPWATLCVMVGIAGFAADFLLPLQSIRQFSWGIPSALLVYGLLCFEYAKRFRSPGFLVRIGDASYSLYLVHWFVLPPVGRAWAKSGLGHHLPGDLLVALGIVASTGAALIVHRYLEKPLIRWVRRILLPPHPLATLEPGRSGARSV
jgi:peptidoglycan/LPS O-acetylase OafA/YrhL